MAVDVQKYMALRKRHEEAKQAHARAQGVLDEQMRKLKQDYGVDTLEEAEAKLVALRVEQAEAEAVCNKAMADYEEKWGKLI